LSDILPSTTSQADFLKYLLKRVSARSLNLFVGAGISKNPPSNLPLASEFRTHFFKEVCTQEKLAEVYVNYQSKLDKIPFESFATSIISDTNFIDTFIRIFSFGMPNKNHNLIAWLISNGYVSKVLTTNFDELIEQAGSTHNEIGLRVLYNEGQFNAVNLHSIKSPVICKIHGGVQEPASIRTILNLIAKEEFQQSRSKILDYFFRTSGKDVLVLGYSCSDVFDINPFIENLKSKIKILVVKHESNCFRIEELSKPFDHFSGCQIVCNTNIIIDYFWNKLIGTKYYENKNVNEKWRRAISEWNEGLNSAQRLYLAGKILVEANEPKKASELLKQGLNKASNKKLRAHICLTLAQSQALMGVYSEAARLWKESLPILEEEKDDIRVAQCYAYIGRIEKLKGNYDEAEKLFRKSLMISEKIGFQDGKARVLHEIGTVYQRRGDFKKAKKIYKQSYELHRKNGDLSGMASSLHQLGVIERIKGNIKSATKLFTESLEIYEKLGSLLDIAGSKHELANCEKASGQLDRAQELFEESLQILNAINEHARIAWTLHDYGTVFYLKGDYNTAEKLTQRSLKIKRSNNDQKGIVESLGNLAAIRIQQGKYVEAENLLMEAWEINQNLKNRHAGKRIVKILETIYSKNRDLAKLRKLAEMRASLFLNDWT
jgi:tetratricopeptide (TPR) repeat protein